MGTKRQDTPQLSQEAWWFGCQQFEWCSPCPRKKLVKSIPPSQPFQGPGMQPETPWGAFTPPTTTMTHGYQGWGLRRKEIVSDANQKVLVRPQPGLPHLQLTVLFYATDPIATMAQNDGGEPKKQTMWPKQWKQIANIFVGHFVVCCLFHVEYDLAFVLWHGRLSFLGGTFVS